VTPAPPAGGDRAAGALRRSSVAEVETDRRRWRATVLAALLWFCSGATAASGLLVWVTTGKPIWEIFVAAFAILLTATSRRLGYGLRTGLLLASLWAGTLATMARLGFNPPAFVALLALAIFAAILLGPRAGIAGIGLGVGTTWLVWLLHRQGLVVRRPEWPDLLDSASAAVTARIATVYLLFATVVIVSVSYVLNRAEQLLRQKAAALDALDDEQRVRERAQADLVRREAAYRKAQELETLGRLSGMVAHDFNNALAVITVAVEELQQEPGLGAAGREAVASILTATIQGAAATRQLRVFGAQPARGPGALALAPVVERAGSVLKRVLPASIEVVLDMQAPPVVLAEEGQVMRTLTNLALNARDAMRDGGRLTLRLRPARPEEQGPGPSFVAMEVEDTGVGMSEEVQARLFEPYYTTKGEGGTGLGLASVREIVEAAGGRVDVASAVGRGTTVTVLWPETPPDAAG
jgi:signal transduction histidine kinase